MPKELHSVKGVKGASISGWEASVALDRRDFGVSADQSLIGKKVDIFVFIEADLRKTAQVTP